MEIILLSFIAALLLMHYSGITDGILKFNNETQFEDSGSWNAITILFIAIMWAAIFFGIAFGLHVLATSLRPAVPQTNIDPSFWGGPTGNNQ